MTPSAIGGLVLLIVLCVLFVIGIIAALLKRYKVNRRIEQEWRKPPKQPPLREIHVAIRAKQCFTRSEGFKTPRCVRVFQIRVLPDGARPVTYTVDEELYHAIREKVVGTLAFAGDRVYGFCEDE